MTVGRRRIKRFALALLVAGAVWLSAPVASALAALIAFAGVALLQALIGDRAPAISERVLGTEPLAIAVGSDIGFYSDGWSVALSGDLDDHATPPHDLHHLQARSHLAEAGAFDVGESHLLLALEGRSVDAIRITEIRSRVSKRFQPLSGALVRSPSAGEQRIVAGQVDLDQEEAALTAEEGGERYFKEYFVTLCRGEFWEFRIVGSVTRSACEWELVVSYIHRGETHQLIVDNAGRPFRTTAKAEQYRSRYLWAWFEKPARLVHAPEPSSSSV